MESIGVGMRNQEKFNRVQAWLGRNTYNEYIGVESYTWTLQNFQHWIDTVTPNQPDSVFVKVGEWGHEWYQSIGGFSAIRTLFTTRGIGSVPYVFCRPQTYTQDAEIAAKNALLAGGVCLDCEEQFLNNNTELYKLIGNTREIAGNGPVILVSGYGDPVTAVPGWDFGALAPADAYQPQWYVGWWDVYHRLGWQHAIGWGDGQCAQAFAAGKLGTDFPIQPAINVEQVTWTDIYPMVQYLVRAWQLSVTLWEAQDITPAMRAIVRAACNSVTL